MTSTTAERSRGLSLGTRIFLISALSIIFAVGVAAFETFRRGNAIAREATVKALERSAAAQRNLQQQYDAQLGRLAATFTDQYLTAYLIEGIGRADVASIDDILKQRQDDFGFNFAIVLDRTGRVVYRTDRRGGSGGENLSRRPLVVEAREGKPAVGVWLEDEALYNAVAIPLATQFELAGTLIAGFKIDEVLANDLEAASGTKVAFLAAGERGVKVVASTLGSGASSELVSALGGRRALTDGQRAETDRSLTIDGRPWLARVTPLLDHPDGVPVGGTVALVSLDEQLAPFRRLQWVQLIVGLLSIATALALSFGLGRRVLGPIRRLVKSAEAARQGDYEQKVPLEGRDEVGNLARSFNHLLSDLRQKRDMEVYLGDLARNLPEPARGGAATLPTQMRPLTLVGLELRRFARIQTTSDPQHALQRLARDLRKAASATSARQGRVEAIAGHRLLLSFDGDAKSLRALGAAAEIAAAVGSPEDAFDEPAEPLVALATGNATSGTVSLGEAAQPSVLGLPVQKLESLMREATPGEILLAREVQDELASALAAAGVTPAAQRGVLGAIPYCVVKLDDAARLTGVDVSTPAAPTVVTTRSAVIAELAPGKILGGRFEILSQLGAGGMGVVYKARDRELGDLVALKVLRRQAYEDPVQLERLKDELRLARKITHPNVLRTFDFGELDGVHFISMEFVRGVTLRYMLDQSDRLPFSAGLRVAKQLCAGLGAAHQQGVIHRDIKPDNLILDQAGNAKLMDFGIARPVERLTPGHTQQGWIVGTPQFMAPEQLEGGEVDARADVYSTGVLLYELFSGQLPFTGTTPLEIAMKHINEPPAPPSLYWAEIPLALEKTILTCLAKKPAERFATIEQLGVQLEALSA